MNRLFSFPTWIFLLLWLPAQSFAVSLGDIEVNSVLGMPLNAEIQLNGVSAEQIQGISASLATADAFRRVGIERIPALNNLRFESELSSSGSTVIHVSSAGAIQDPYLNFLVELRWPRGRLLREYSILLDSPVFAPTQSITPVNTPRVLSSPETLAPASEQAVNAETSSRQPAAIQSTVQAKPEPAIPQPRQQSAVSADTGALREYRTQRGDTLSTVVNQFHPGGDASVQQVMLAMLRINPQAFGNDNINDLKSGAVLRIPDIDEATRLTQLQARAEVARQYSLWQEYRGRLTQNRVDVAPIAAPSKEEQEPDATETTATNAPAEDSSDSVTEDAVPIAEAEPFIANKAEPEPISQPAEPESQVENADAEDSSNLKILAAEANEISPGSQPDFVGEGEPNEATLALSQERDESRRLEVEQLNAQIQELNTILEKQKQVIELQNDQLGALQQRLAQADALELERLQNAEYASNNLTEIKFTSSYLKWVWMAAILFIVPLLLFAAYMLFLKEDKLVKEDNGYPIDMRL